MRYKKVAILVGLMVILGVGVYFLIMQKDQRRLTLTDFGFLGRGSSLDEMIARIGEPDRYIGSGLILLEYDLVNGGMVGLTFSDQNTLQIAVYYRPDGETVVLFERQE